MTKRNEQKPLWRRISEWLFIALAFAVWVASAPLIRLMDPTAAVFDAGVFQAFVYAVIGLFIFITVVWFILWYRFPGVYRFLDKHFSETFKNLEQWQKLKLSLSLFFAFLFALVFLASIVL